MNIPPEALEAGAREIAEQLGDDWDDNVHTFCGDDFQMTPDGAKEACRQIARAAIAAALEAWPGIRKPMRVNGLQSECWLELPLPQEASDAKR